MARRIFPAVFAFVVASLVVGALLPRHHTASSSIVVKRDPQSVYAVVRDVGKYPQWRKELTKVEILDATHFREVSEIGTTKLAIDYAIDADEPGRKLVTHIVDPKRAGSDSRTYLFEKAAAGTRLTITDSGDTPNIVGRLLRQFVFTDSAAIDLYLRALEKRLL